MTVIACLAMAPTEALCEACARLTPVVEPQTDRIFMDWTGCGPVPELARRLDEALLVLGGRRNVAKAAGDLSGPLGVAPLRFVAEIVAREGAAETFRTASRASPKSASAGPASANFEPEIAAGMRIPGGRYVDEQTLPRFLHALPVERLPGIDEKTKRTLDALAVRRLGDVRQIRPHRLRDRIGAAADTLLDWARGRDARPVAPLYPPERLRSRVPGPSLAAAFAGDREQFALIVDGAVVPLLARLSETGRAAAHAAVYWAGGRRVRPFAEPVADGALLTRVMRTLAERLVAERAFAAGAPSAAAPDGGFPFEDDLIVEIVPARGAPEQTSLWRHGPARSLHQARLQTVVDALRRRFGPAIGFAGPREAVVRYEAMMQLHGFKG